MNRYEPGRMWRFQPFADCPALYTSNPPNWFHRFMQRLLLGIKWTRE